LVAGLNQLQDGARRQPPHDSEWHAFHLRLDLAGRLHPHELDRDGEPEFHVGDLRLERRRIVHRVDLVEVVHAVHAAADEAGIAQLGEDSVARRRDGDFAGEFHGGSGFRHRAQIASDTARYWVWMLAAFANATVPATSFLKNVANSASVIAIGSMPSAAKRSRTAGACSALAVSWCSLSTMARGVFAGTNSPL